MILCLPVVCGGPGAQPRPPVPSAYGGPDFGRGGSSGQEEPHIWPGTGVLPVISHAPRHAPMLCAHAMPDMPLQHADMPLQYADMPLQHADMPLQHADMLLQHADMLLQYTDMPLQPSDPPTHPPSYPPIHPSIQVITNISCTCT
eukprot:100930-Chlamydomonas_euryale.AAC.1